MSDALKQTCLHRLAEEPDNVELLCELGQICAERLEHHAAEVAYRRAAGLDPTSLRALHGLARACLNLGRVDEGIRLAQTGIKLAPEQSEFWSVLGTLYRDEGRIDEGTRHLQKALELAPERSPAAQRLLFQSLLDADATPLAIVEAHRRWAAAYAAPFYPTATPRLVPPAPGERWRVGYVSADWLRHPVGQFSECLLRHHDRTRFEVFCYFTSRHRDARTDELSPLPEHWIEAGEMDDDALSERIRQDRIHVLVDLSGHTPGGRPLVFARQPAPIQAAYLGYASTTGLRTVGYRITDAWADPPGANDGYWTERLIRFPASAWAFTAAANTPPVSALPAATQGGITFGGFNNCFKCCPFTLALWARILHRLPDSRLVLRGRPFRDPGARERMWARFEGLGIERGRVELQRWESNHPVHLAGYHGIDVALDTYPYHGTTTTCDALHMGVPVVTLAGRAHVSRVGVSLLNNVGLAEACVAETADEYVDKAVRLASDLGALAVLRAELRQRFESSPLADGPRHAREMEMAFLRMVSDTLGSS